MSIRDRFLALISAPAYALRRSKAGFLRLHVGVIVLCLVGAAYVAYRGWQEGFALTHAALAVVCLLVVTLMVWAEAHRYVVFHPLTTVVPEGTRDLAPEEKLFVRGSGTFEVSDMSRYLVEVPAVFWPTQLAEHILAAKVRAFSLLGVGVPSGERGWWYIFLEARRVIEIVPGELCFGLRLRPAVRVLHRTDKGHELLYLSCDTPQQLAVLFKELQGKMEAERARNEE